MDSAMEVDGSFPSKDGALSFDEIDVDKIQIIKGKPLSPGCTSYIVKYGDIDGIPIKIQNVYTSFHKKDDFTASKLLSTFKLHSGYHVGFINIRGDAVEKLISLVEDLELKLRSLLPKASILSDLLIKKKNNKPMNFGLVSLDNHTTARRLQPDGSFLNIWGKKDIWGDADVVVSLNRIRCNRNDGKIKFLLDDATNYTYTLKTVSPPSSEDEEEFEGFDKRRRID